MSSTDPLRRLLGTQDEVATRQQLVALGVTPAAIRWNAGRSWRVVLPRVYLLSRERPTPRQRLRAAVLWAGGDAVLSGPTAARLYGVTAADAGGRVHLVTSPPRRGREAGFATVRRSLLQDRGRVHDGLPVSSVARAVVDSAVGSRFPDRREALFIESVQRRLTTVEDLAEWIYRLRPRDAAGLHLALRAAASGAWSVPEHDLLTLMSGSAHLPRAMPNPMLCSSTGASLTRPDAWLDDVAMAIMVHSHRYHSQGEDWDRTVASDADLVSAGVVVVGVTPRQIGRGPGDVIRRIESAYAVARRRPRPDVRATAQ